mmetsp:Transcript_46440/g.101011  ORF Transcript_46440/g.101011 Transcript_46440/m.101011 type:complete len:223 (-) Transcript_46440:490-1158(-)
MVSSLLSWVNQYPRPDRGTSCERTQSWRRFFARKSAVTSRPNVRMCLPRLEGRNPNIGCGSAHWASKRMASSSFQSCPSSSSDTGIGYGFCQQLRPLSRSSATLGVRKSPPWTTKTSSCKTAKRGSCRNILWKASYTCRPCLSRHSSAKPPPQERGRSLMALFSWLPRRTCTLSGNRSLNASINVQISTAWLPLSVMSPLKRYMQDLEGGPCVWRMCKASRS